MKVKNKKGFCITLCWAVVFIAWTVAVCNFDLQAIGPNHSVVGFATANEFFHKLTGVHMLLYNITDVLGFAPLCIVCGFGLLGLVQLVKRRSLLKVDSDILVLGGFYLIVLGAYGLFEILSLNYRPVLIEGVLEASYPSSTTLLTMCVMPTAIMQLRERMHHGKLKTLLTYIMLAFTIFMVGSRLISGVHWLTDIIGGAFLSVQLVMLYRTVNDFVQSKYELNNRSTTTNTTMLHPNSKKKSA